MTTYIKKNMWETTYLTELRIKKFEEVQAFGLSKSEVIKEESKEEVQEEVKDEENDSDKENDELRLYLTIAQDEEKEVDYEILDRKYPIKEWKTECLGAKPQSDQAEHLEEINLNVVIRSNGQKRYFSTLMTVLSIFDREDLNAVYQLVMDKYQDEMPEGFDRVLWGDLMVLFNSDDKDEFWSSQQDWKIVSWKLHSSSGVHTLVTDTGLIIHMLVEKKYPLRKEVLKQMLKLKLESEEENTMALELIKFVRKILAELESEEHKNWLVHKQTACGKDFSNPFMVDNLPKIVGLSTHLAFVVKSWLVHDQTVHALTSPKAKPQVVPINLVLSFILLMPPIDDAKLAETMAKYYPDLVCKYYPDQPSYTPPPSSKPSKPPTLDESLVKLADIMDRFNTHLALQNMKLGLASKSLGASTANLVSIVIKESNGDSSQLEVIKEPTGDGYSDYYPSNESYCSHLSSDDNDDANEISNYDYSNTKKSLEQRVHNKSARGEFMHLSSKITLRLKRATQGWITSIVMDKVRSDGDVSVAELKRWLMKNFSVDIPYHKVFIGKEQAYTDMYGKWDDSFFWMNAFREELSNKNPGSVVEINFETIDDKKCFKHFFISLAACSRGFLGGFRPYISLDACHLKGKFNGVLAAGTSIDGNNSISPVAYSVIKSKNTSSWTWFLESLKKAIGTPDGLVISSDMQKGLEGDFFKLKLWAAANTYCSIEHERLMKEIASVSEDAITYLTTSYNKLWSPSKFGTTCKCDYMTNNISEAFNLWVGTFRYQPVLDLLDNIREKILKRIDKKRRIVRKWDGSLVLMAKSYLRSISKASEYEVKGLPCVHVAAFISFTRDNLEKYCDPYFTIEKFKDAYAFAVATMPEKD
ncbi:uncharacterized protein Tco_0922639 [Tanacetum coccineum]|uniref:MULE transposase domain-containing protein n=1 Tax=Tanacetum coccineum TaxID=301880 RepID=A0ABQ5CYN4_9ASTR